MFLAGNILGLYRESPRLIQFALPAREISSFVGYDLIEEQTQISALTNCGGFPDVSATNELNRFGPD